MWRGPFSSNTSKSWQKRRPTDFQHRKYQKNPKTKVFKNRKIKCWEWSETSFDREARPDGLILRGKRPFKVWTASFFMVKRRPFGRLLIRVFQLAQASSARLSQLTAMVWLPVGLLLASLSEAAGEISGTGFRNRYYQANIRTYVRAYVRTYVRTYVT